jgi:putative membrane protein
MIGTGMMGWGGLGGFGWVGLLLNLIITAVVIVGFVLLVVWLVRRTGINGTSTIRGAGGEQSPREILQTRYARGEITREQYEIMKQDLQ